MISGVKIEEFWENTYGENISLIEAYKARIDLESKNRALLDHRLADLIGISVARLMDSKTKLPGLEEAYPFLFIQNQNQEQIDKDKEHLEMQRKQAMFLEFAKNHNAKMKKKNNK